MREIPSWQKPVMELLCPFDNSTSVGSSRSQPASTELEEAVLKVFEGIGFSMPSPVENLAGASNSLDAFCTFTARCRVRPRIVNVS